MFDQILKSLVLRGSSVLCDGKSAGARGTSYLARTRTPVAQVITSRPSQPDTDTEPEAQVENPPANRAGRPVRTAGVLSSRTPTSVGGAWLAAWSWARGGSSRAAVMSGGQQATAMTPAGEVFLASRPAVRRLMASLHRHGCAKPAGRIPPASRGRQGS
jgi:hypothetical protein